VSEYRGPVALISHSYSGVSHYSYSLARKLAGSRCGEVHLVTNKAFDCDENPPLIIARLFGRSRWLPFHLLRLVAYIVKHRVRVLHLQGVIKYPILTYIAILMARVSGRRVVFTAHDILPHYARSYHRFVMRLIYEEVDGVIVHSRDNLCALQSLVPQVGNAVVIPHGLYDIFAPEPSLNRVDARRRLGLQDGAKIILFFGRIDKRKGAEALVEQLPLLAEKEPDILVLMVGQSAYAPGFLEGLASSRGVGRHLKVINGWVDDADVGTYFAAADAVILPYLEGSTSGFIKIALTTGTPVIATRVGELPEVIQDTGCGILVDSPFSEQDVDNIMGVVSGAGLESIRCNTDAWKKSLSWTVIAEKTCAFYKKVIAT